MLLGKDEYTGITEVFHFDKQTGKTIIESIQDVEPILEANKQLNGKLNKKEDWWKIGTIPNVVLLQWSKECGHPPYSKEWHDYSLKKLNDRDFRNFNPNKVKI